MLNKIKIALWGYDKSAESKLNILCTIPDVTIEGVVIPTNRDANLTKGIRTLARKHNINVYEPEYLKNNDAFYENLEHLKPDLFIVDSYTKLIPKKFLDMPKLGGFNFHSGKLPQYRGQHVMNWAIINGEKKITVTAHRLDEEFDSGDIVLEEEIEISFLDDIRSVYRKVIESGEGMVKDLINKIKSDNLILKPQAEKGAKHYPARIPGDGKISWENSNVKTYNLIRALLPPWPCAFFEHEGQRIKIYEAYPIPAIYKAIPGTVVSVSENAFCVAAKEGWLLVKKADKIDFRVGTVV